MVNGSKLFELSQQDLPLRRPFAYNILQYIHSLSLWYIILYNTALPITLLAQKGKMAVACTGISKDAQCLCQRMSLNNRTTIAGSRRVYQKACIRLSKCACGKTDGDAASPNKNYSKIPCGDSQTAQLSSHTHIVLLAPTAPNY